MWESRALRLLTIFFCGAAIVSPTFFRSLGEGAETKEVGETQRRRDRKTERERERCKREYIKKENEDETMRR